jgi:hypothetical protein
VVLQADHEEACAEDSSKGEARRETMIDDEARKITDNE